MSSKINKLLSFPNRIFDTVLLVSIIPNKLLADFVRSEMKRRELGYREVASKSGGLITYGTVFDVVNERTKSPTISTITGLAKGLGVPEEKMFRIARGAGPIDLGIEEELINYVRDLPKVRREDLVRIARMFFEQVRSTKMTEPHVIVNGTNTATPTTASDVLKKRGATRRLPADTESTLVEDETAKRKRG